MRQRKSKILVISLALVMLAQAMWAPISWGAPARRPAGQVQEIVLQNGRDGYAGCTDTSIDRWHPDSNLDGQNLKVQWTSSGDTFSSFDWQTDVMWFCLAGVPVLQCQ